MQDGSTGEVAAVPEVRSSHHVLWIVHLLCQFRDSNGTEFGSTTASKWCKADHKEMKTREGNHIDSQFAEIRVKLTGETKTGSNTRHDSRNEMVQVAVRGVR